MAFPCRLCSQTAILDPSLCRGIFQRKEDDVETQMFVTVVKITHFVGFVCVKHVMVYIRCLPEINVSLIQFSLVKV